MRPLDGLSVVDYRGDRFVLGRTRQAYAIWSLDEGGTPVSLYDLSESGWEEVWARFRELEDVDASAPWSAAGQDALRPMLAGEIVGRSFRVWGQNFWTLAGISALLLVPTNVLLLVLNMATLRSVPTTIEGDVVRVPQVSPEVSLAGNLLTSVVTAILTGAVAVAVSSSLLGRRPRIGPSMAAGFRRAGSLIWAVLLELFAVLAPLVPAIVVTYGRGPSTEPTLVGLILLALAIPLAAFLFLRLLFTPVVVVLEGMRGVDALQRSWALARGFGGRILGVLLLIGLILAGIFLLAFLLLTPILVQGGVNDATFRVFFFATFAVGAVVGIVAGPLIHVSTVMLYLDARVRKEALTLGDLERALPSRA